MRQYKTSPERRKAAAERRDRLRALNKCINGPLVGNVARMGIVHGEPVKAGKCAACYLVGEAHQ